MDQPRDVIPAADAARLLGLSRQRVHALWKSGHLPGFHRYKRLYLDAGPVRARIEGRAPEPAPDRVTIAQLATRLGVTAETVRKYHRQGLLRGGELGPDHRLTFPADVLDDFIQPVVGLERRKQPYNSRFRRPPTS